VEPVEAVKPLKSISEVASALDGQDSLMDELVTKSLKKKKKSKVKLELKASTLKQVPQKIEDDLDSDDDDSVAKSNFVESSIKQALKIKQLE
jgi:hypothetical protein